MDITFYTLDFSEKLILPPSSKNVGYISMNAVAEFNNNGSLQLVFRDDELEQFAKSHHEGLLLKWGKFEGYVTDYQFIHDKKTLYGSHLNALTHKGVIPPQNITNESIDAVMDRLITTYVPGLTYVNSGFDDVVEFSTDTCKYADEFFKEYLGKSKLGFLVYMSDATLKLKVLSSNVNPEIFSIGNKNVYEIQEDFSNKTIAFGGWYKKTEEDDGTKLDTEEWIYITSSEKTGIFRQDVILNANSPTAAKDELTTCVNKHSFACKTRNIEYQTDYRLGDVVRLQTDGNTVKKQITGVDMWYEGATYHEEPTLSEWEE